MATDRDANNAASIHFERFVPPGNRSTCVVWPKHVKGQEDHDVEALADNAEEDTVHQLLAGYWKLGIRSGQLGWTIGQLLANGTRVFIVGVRRHNDSLRVVRVLEVDPASVTPLPETDRVGTWEFQRCEYQGPELFANYNEVRLQFATAYDRSDGQTRYRLHTTSVDDETWRGVAVLDLPQNPGLYETRVSPPTRFVVDRE